MFKNPFSFNGRIRRTEYGITFIIRVVCYFVVLYLVKHGYPAAILLYIPALWFLWAQGAKRCHDISNSGWYQIIPFYFLWLIFQKGDRGENDYGDDPKGEAPTDLSAVYQDPSPAVIAPVVSQSMHSASTADQMQSYIISQQEASPFQTSASIQSLDESDPDESYPDESDPNESDPNESDPDESNQD